MNPQIGDTVKWRGRVGRVVCRSGYDNKVIVAYQQSNSLLHSNWIDMSEVLVEKQLNQD